jgi:hypothetical protein
LATCEGDCHVVPPNGIMYTERSALALQSTTLLTDHTPIGVLLAYEGTQRWPRPSRLVAAGAEHALGYRPPRQSCFTATESAPIGVERLTEHANVSKCTFYLHFSG